MTGPTEALPPEVVHAIERFRCASVGALRTTRNRLHAAIRAYGEAQRRAGMEAARLECIAEQTMQGARRHEHSYYEGMEVGASNCRVRIDGLIRRLAPTSSRPTGTEGGTNG